MKKHLFLMAALGLGLAACTNDVLTPEDNANITSPDQENSTSTLKSAKLKSFDASPDRVKVEPQTRDAQPGSLTLIASITNPSTQEGIINGFQKEGEEGRYLSATCVYFDSSDDKYYVTYHMQGNNYLTDQIDETSGFIETFTLQEDGTPNPGKIYQTAEPSKVDFDFNHLYFDVLNDDYLSYTGADAGQKRIVAAGHIAVPTSTGKYDTHAMISQLDLENEEIAYTLVLTGEKLLNEEGKSLGDIDAGDVNCVLRKSNYYYLATRKGIAVLNAKDDNLFTPINNIETIENENGQKTSTVIENSTYFVKTPGSAKHLSHIYTNSHFSLLYLTSPNPSTITAETSSPANIINFSMDQGSGTLCGSDTSDSNTEGPGILNSSDITDLTLWSPNVNQYTIPETNICPVDGKNVLSLADNNNLITACLGKNGLYVNNKDNHKEEVIKFSDKKDGTGSRPVNGVFVEGIEYYDGGRATNGFIYVANGACLTILDAATLEKVEEFSAFDAKEDKNLASANYVQVVKTNTYTNPASPDRIITVAFGQAGVKVFRFVPPTLK
ncbi:MAG: hypothetical protein J1E95_00835 [Muribaculaceae bacterium]|nr:hypothetical protein [Muribaculaceae bacterium]